MEKKIEGALEKEKLEPPKLKGIQRPRRMTAIAVTGLFILALLAVFYVARDFFLPIVLAWTVTLLLKPVVRGLKKIGIPEAFGAFLVIACIVGGIVGGALLLSQPVKEWIGNAPQAMRTAETKVRALLSPAQKFKEAAAEVEKISNGTAVGEETEPVTKVEVKKPGFMNVLLSRTTSLLMLAGETLVLVYFMLVSGDLLMLKAIQVLPKFGDKKRAVEIAHEIQEQVSRYLGSITMLNMIEGTMVGIGMALAGMPNPILWGVLAAFVNYIPYLGAMMCIGVISIVSLVTFDSIGRALTPPLIYLGINLSDNFIAPFFLGKRMVLNPVVIFLVLMFWGWIWGIIGVLLAVPITMAFKIVCEKFESLAPIAELLSGEEKPESAVKAEEEAEMENAAAAGGKA